MPRRFCTPLLTTVTGAVTLASLGGCGWRDREPCDGLATDTARFSYDGRAVEVPLTACGREGDVVVLAGRTAGGIVVQAEADLGDGGFDRTGVTADLVDDGIIGAFGAEMDHGPAGEITDVRVEGDRLIVEGTWVMFDDQLAAMPPPGEAQFDGELVARCPETEDDVAAVDGRSPLLAVATPQPGDAPLTVAR